MTESSSGRSIAFGGHFAIGETMVRGHLATMRAAAAESGDLAILVDDVGVRQKLWCFMHGGRDRLVASYRDRWQCARSSCLRSYLPPPEVVLKIVDEAQYAFIESQLSAMAPDVLNYLKTVDLESMRTADRAKYATLTTLLRQKILPRVVERRVRDYHLTHKLTHYALEHRVAPPNVTVFSEQHLINIVTRRTRGRYSDKDDSWRRLGALFFADSLSRTVMVGIEEVVSDHGSPLCRGIMLALYQELGRSGYSQVYEHYLTNAETSVEGAHGVYNVIKRRFPAAPDWQLAFESSYYARNGRILTCPLC